MKKGTKGAVNSEAEKKAVGIRIKEFAEQKFTSQKELATALGMVPQTLQQYTSGKSKLNSEVMKKLADLGADINYILTGNLLQDKIKEDVIKEIKTNTMGYDFPILKNLSELKKSDLYQSSTFDKLSFTYQKKHGCFVLKVDGDSMSPTVENGDYVLVDEELKLYDGAIVAAKLKSGEQFIKRYRVLPEEFIQLDSDNFVYDPITLKKNETEYLIPVVMLQRNIYKNQTM